jgi:hypothetical protein
MMGAVCSGMPRVATEADASRRHRRPGGHVMPVVDGVAGMGRARRGAVARRRGAA